MFGEIARHMTVSQIPDYLRLNMAYRELSAAPIPTAINGTDGVDAIIGLVTIVIPLVAYVQKKSENEVKTDEKESENKMEKDTNNEHNINVDQENESDDKKDTNNKINKKVQSWDERLMSTIR
ncbi:17560_t:CDS:2, partial [Acaulospora colombiana]